MDFFIVKADKMVQKVWFGDLEHKTTHPGLLLKDG